MALAKQEENELHVSDDPYQSTWALVVMHAFLVLATVRTTHGDMRLYGGQEIVKINYLIVILLWLTDLVVSMPNPDFFQSSILRA